MFKAPSGLCHGKDQVTQALCSSIEKTIRVQEAKGCLEEEGKEHQANRQVSTAYYTSLQTGRCVGVCAASLDLGDLGSVPRCQCKLGKLPE